MDSRDTRWKIKLVHWAELENVEQSHSGSDPDKSDKTNTKLKTNRGMNDQLINKSSQPISSVQQWYSLMVATKSSFSWLLQLSCLNESNQDKQDQFSPISHPITMSHFEFSHIQHWRWGARRDSWPGWRYQPSLIKLENKHLRFWRPISHFKLTNYNLFIWWGRLATDNS